MSAHSIAEGRKQEWTNFKTDSMRYYDWDRNAENRLTSAILSVSISSKPYRRNFEPISRWRKYLVITNYECHSLVSRRIARIAIEWVAGMHADDESPRYNTQHR